MKMGKRLSAALLAFVMLFGAGTKGNASSSSDQEYLNKAAQSVLLLEAMDDKGKAIGYGSGFVLFDNYTLVTSYQLVKDAGWVNAYSSDDKYYLLSKVIAADEKRNIALLEFFSPTNLKPIPIRPSEAASTSGLVTAIGGPRWDRNDIAQGAIRAVLREDDLSYIQFEADLKQGMDGGVLVDVFGQASGMILGPVKGGQGTFKALDIQEVKSFAEANWELERMEFFDYFHKDDAVKAKIDEWLAEMMMSTPTVAPNPTEAPTPKMDSESFLQVGDEAYWDKKDGYWQVNPKLVNSSKTLSADRFTLAFYCEDANGDLIQRYGDGDYVAYAVFDMVIGPGEEKNPGYTWLDGYENVKCINMAISQVHFMDGRTIEIPMEDWQVIYIKLE